MKYLENRVAIVTGAGRGWGQAIAVKLAEAGAQVITVARTGSELDNTVSMIRKIGGKCEGVRLDVSDDAAVAALIEKIMSDYGRLDITVNNAAILSLKTFDEMTMEEADRILSVNLRAYLFICKHAVRIMKEHGGGSIINVSSNSGVEGFSNESIYCTAKHGIEGFSKSIAQECREFNIAVNTITPGGNSVGLHIKPTSITQAQYDDLSPEEQQKWGDPLLFSDAFVFLALQRPQAGGISGERFAAYELSEHIRQHGMDISLADMKFDAFSQGKY